LVLVALLVGRAIRYFGGESSQTELALGGVFLEEPNLLPVIGCTALKARNCFTASS
jgi:hypothetical protein